DPTASGQVKPLQPPYYLTLQMPSQDAPTFSLMSTYIPGGGSDRNILTGFLAVDAEPGSEAGVRSEAYGTPRLLELPRNATVPGPGQVQNNFNTDPTAADGLLALRRGDSTVINGNLLTLPVGGGLLYVQPVYVQSTEGTRFPLLRKVLVSFGDEIGFADTLDEALDQVFGGDSGANAGDADGGVETEVPDQPADGETADPGTTDPGTTDPDAGEPDAEQPAPPADGGTVDGGARAELDQALRQAQQAIEAGEAALAEGDFAAYGEAQDRLRQALEAALAAEQRLDTESSGG